MEGKAWGMGAMAETEGLRGLKDNAYLSYCLDDSEFERWWISWYLQLGERGYEAKGIWIFELRSYSESIKDDKIMV